MPDPTPYFGHDVRRISNEHYTILRHANQFRFPRSATETLFHTQFQQDVYHHVYEKKNFSNHRYVNWGYLNQNPLYNGLYTLLRRVDLEDFVTLKCDYHAKVIKQFYAIVYVSPEFDYLSWMTGVIQVSASKANFHDSLLILDTQSLKVHVEHTMDLTLVDEYYDAT